ncbi:MAG: signal peptidase II [Acidimicrobiales bacterium]|nr:signal peptidase II [Acidimicrobiales bacterium]
MDQAPSTRRGRRLAFLATAAAVVAADQLTKQLALSELADGPVDLIGSLRLNLTFNDGAAFSIGSGRTTGIALLALAVSGVVAWLGLRAVRSMAAVGYGFVFGGAVGNLVDRALRAGDGFLGGRVVDFVDLQWWAVFNLADAALWVGIGLLLVDAWREQRDRVEAEEPS